MNKEREKFAFNIFRELHGNLTEAIDSESPDFIINQDGKRIGIELVELMEEESGPTSSAAKYSLEDKIATAAKKHFDLISDRRIMVVLQIVDNLKLSSTNIDHLGKEIAAIMLTTIQKYPYTLTHNLEIIENLPKGILGIFFDITPFMTESHFSVMRGKWVGSFNLNELNRVIDKKNILMATYKKKADLIYLLIIEGIPPNSWLGPFNRSGSLIENNFEKIFLLKIMSRQLFEIK